MNYSKTFFIIVALLFFSYWINVAGNEALAQSSDFYITLDPANAAILQGESASLGVNIIPLAPGILPQSVSLTATGYPPSMTVSFEPSSCELPCSSVMRVETSSSISSGTYPIAVLGVGGGLTKTAIYNLAVNPLPQFDFSISLVPTSSSIVVGGGTNVGVNLSYLTGTSQDATFAVSNVPIGAAVEFNPTTCSPSCSATMMVSTSSEITAGVYPITVLATAGGLTKTQDFNLTITPLSPQPVFDFGVSILPASAIILQGGNAVAAINLSLISGTPSDVTFTAIGLPLNTEVSFNPDSCSAPCSSVMSIATSDDTQVGSYLVTILGISEGISKTTEFSLSVRKTLPLLYAPTLLAPLNNVRLSTAIPYLDWTDVKDVGIYLWDIGGKRGTTTVSQAVVPEGVLEYNKSYLWKVRACLDSSLTYCGPWSRERSFFTPVISREELIRQIQAQIAVILAEIARLQRELQILLWGQPTPTPVI